MFSSLLPEMLSINGNLPGAIALAAKHGFGGVDTQANHLTSPELDLESISETMAKHHLRPGYVGIPPGRIPAADTDWQVALESLPIIAQNAQKLGFARAALVVLPFHETLSYDEAFAEHVQRINAVTNILDDYGIALALEYVSPLSRRAPYAHHFVHDMPGMLTLCDALASPHVGLLLDSFHWHCAGESTEEIARLPKERVVIVHINDAPDRPNDEQTVGERALPGATGVINLTGFVAALKKIGYDGPVTCEPMAQAVSALHAGSDDEVIALTAAALRKVL